VAQGEDPEFKAQYHKKKRKKKAECSPTDVDPKFPSKGDVGEGRNCPDL
jgi:hypothetical protein